MKRNCQHRPNLRTRALDHRHDASGGKRNSSFGKRQAVTIGYNRNCLLYIVEIVERLSHSHHHHIGDTAILIRRGPVAKRIPRHHNLADNFEGSQIAYQPLRAGMAKAAIQRATDLARHTKRSTVSFRNINRFEFQPRCGA